MLILDTSDLQFPRHDSASLNLPKRIAGFIGALSAPLNAAAFMRRAKIQGTHSELVS